MGNQLWTSIKKLATSDKVQPVEEEKREISVVPNALPTLDVPDKYKNQRRRVSVSAEVDQEANGTFVKKVIPKSEDAVRRIRLAVSNSFLFGGLTSEHTQQVIDAMEERKVQPGDVIIKQGDPGDYFYIIDSGRFDVFKKLPSGEEKKIFEYTDKGSFGELALMYNCPRAATVKATSEGVLWALDRSSFKFIVITGMAKTKNLYQKFLEGVPLFENLTAKERALIADCLQPISYDDGASVIHQGEVGDKFYLIEKGEAVAFQKDEESGEEVIVGKMVPGQYFGERALITNQPRAATVKASGELRLASMDRGAFERLLGDCRVVMQRHMSHYESAQQVRARNMSLSLTEADRRSSMELNQPDMSVTIPHSESDDGRRDSISISAAGPPGHARLVSTGDIQPPTPLRPGSASVVSVAPAPPPAPLPGSNEESGADAAVAQ